MTTTLPLLRTSQSEAEKAHRGENQDPFFVDSVGVSEDEKVLIRELIQKKGMIDPVVSVVIGATNGIMYQSMIGKLASYPLPTLRFPVAATANESLLDVGCNWGRWSHSAAKLGYRTVGIDPSLGAVMAAKRVAAELGLSALFVVGDGRQLPFRDHSFDKVFSYSVLQHFSKEDARTSFREVGRVLKSQGESLLQMPNTFGLRCLYHQARRGFRPATGFEVRYWTPHELLSTIGRAVGTSNLSVDCFFGIGIQESDISLMPFKLKCVTAASKTLRILSAYLPGLPHFADSLYVKSVK